MVEEEGDGCQLCLWLKLQAPAADLACAVMRSQMVPAVAGEEDDRCQLCLWLNLQGTCSFCGWQPFIVLGDCSPQRSPSYGACWEALSCLCLSTIARGAVAGQHPGTQGQRYSVKQQELAPGPLDRAATSPSARSQPKDVGPEPVSRLYRSVCLLHSNLKRLSLRVLLSPDCQVLLRKHIDSTPSLVTKVVWKQKCSLTSCAPSAAQVSCYQKLVGSRNGSKSASHAGAGELHTNGTHYKC